MPRTPDITDEIRILAPTGVCGSGFSEESFATGLRQNPHFIGSDAGSTDPGPSHLGKGDTAFPRDAVKRDLRIMLKGARQLDIPLLLGSAGTAGGDIQLEWLADITREIAREEGLSFKLALIHAEADRELLMQRLEQGRIHALDNAPPISAEVLRNSSHVVGMMGAEPFMRALAAGADVILAGRASDTAIFAAYPTLHGFPEGLAWHAGKILECGAAAVVNRTSPDCMFVWLRRDHFLVEAPNPALRCTPQSIAAHSLYENADPFRLVECPGTVDLTDSQYEAVTERKVKVSGSRFIPAARYTVKLEGAELAGYQSVVIGSVRDPLIIGQIDDRVASIYGARLPRDRFTLNIRVYGKDGTMGALEPVKEIRSHELCLIFEVTAPSQQLASGMAGIIRHQALHLPIPQWSGLVTALACPYNPAHLERGPVYRFTLNHVVEPDSPTEMFPMELFAVNGADCAPLAQGA